MNYVYRYASDSGDDQDTEIGLAEWSKFKMTTMCQWVKDTNKEEKYDFDINKADKIFDLLLQEKQIQLPVGHVLPLAEVLKKRKYCKWHNIGSQHTNEWKVFRQQIQSTIEQGRIKFDDGKGPMKIDVHPFPVNMVHAMIDSSKLISKYQKKHDRRVRNFRRHQDDECYRDDRGKGSCQGDRFDPHWSCEFFRFCWNERMRLPSVEDCPGCSKSSSHSQATRGNGFKSYRNRPEPRKLVHERLGPIHQDYFEDEVEDEQMDQAQNPQWCPTGIFTKS